MPPARIENIRYRQANVHVCGVKKMIIERVKVEIEVIKYRDIRGEPTCFHCDFNDCNDGEDNSYFCILDCVQEDIEEGRNDYGITPPKSCPIWAEREK